MKSRPAKSSLLNVVVAAGADVVVANGMVRIPGMMPVMQTDIVTYIAATDKKTPVVEVPQQVQVGVVTVPVITASTKYQIMAGNVGARIEGAQQNLHSYGYTSPAILTDSALTDRHNAYVSIAAKMNNDPALKATAGAIVSVGHDAEVGVYVVGEEIVGATSGSRGFIISEVANVLTIGITNGIIPVNPEVLTGQSSGATCNTNAAVTVGLGLHITDDAGYYPAKGGRLGPNTVLATKGFTAAMVVITTAGVLGFGQGLRMIDDVPVGEITSNNLAKGTLSFNVQNLPLSGKQYRRYTLKSKPSASDAALSPVDGKTLVIQELWINETDNAGTLAALDAAIVAGWVNV